MKNDLGEMKAHLDRARCDRCFLGNGLEDAHRFQRHPQAKRLRRDPGRLRIFGGINTAIAERDNGVEVKYSGMAWNEEVESQKPSERQGSRGDESRAQLLAARSSGAADIRLGAKNERRRLKL